MRFLRVLLIGIIFIYLSFPLVIFADQSSDIQKEIDELTEKIAETQKKEKTLGSQIGYMDSQIRLGTLRITETTARITQLENDITDLGTKLDKLEQSLTFLSSVALSRIATTYKTGRTSYFFYLFSADSIGDFLLRNDFIQRAQAHDKKVLFEVQQAKTTYGEQKELREAKKQEAEKLKLQLEVQQKQLDVQKKEKQTLLTQTRNDEAEYQRQLQQALSEKNALEAALVSGVAVGPVEKGAPIALVGNTGYPDCSTGAHLHFEVRKNNSWVNPGEYLKNHTVKDEQNGGETSIGSGNWEWPLEGTVRVTQYYGKTPYSWRYAYSGGIHTGIDMTSETSSVIRAPEKGTLYTATQSCGRSTIKIKYIDHGDGLISFFLHVQ